MCMLLFFDHTLFKVLLFFLSRVLLVTEAQVDCLELQDYRLDSNYCLNVVHFLELLEYHKIGFSTRVILDRME